MKKMPLATAVLIVLCVPLMIGVALAESAPSVEVGVYPQEMHGDAALRSETDGFRAVALLPDGTLLAGTDAGLVQEGKRPWKSVDGLPAAGVLALATSGDHVYAATTDALFDVEAGEAQTLAPMLPGTPRSLAVDGETVWLATDSGLYALANGDWVKEPLPGDGDADVRDVAIGGSGKFTMAVAGGSGLYGRDANGSWQFVLPQNGAVRWAPVDVRAVAFDQDGQLWFASPQGVGHQTVDGHWDLFTGAEGLPYNDFTCMAVAPDGGVWFGAHQGAIRYDGKHWAYRAGRRWLAGNDVRDVIAAPDGSAWFATDGGVSQIYFEPMSLMDKAEQFEAAIDKYHRRTPYGYVAGVLLPKPGDTSSWKNRDTDNDGQYTGMYCGTEAFAYAATKDPRFKKRATDAFEALAFLSEVTQGGEHPAPPGFIARTILPANGPDPNEHNSVEHDREKQKDDAKWKVIVPRWPLSKDGEWYWKSDASSDELDGHYFAYATYYDLVAETPEEKARVREVVRRVTDHLLVHQFRLVDHDGQPTRWAHFSPRDLNDDPDWWAERGLNSLSILTYLSVAYHVTEDPKYKEAYDHLITMHAYAMNAMTMPKLQAGPGSFVQFDDKMAFLNYYHLIRYEKDPVLLRMFGTSIYYYWQIVKPEQNPFFNFVYAACCDGLVVKTQWGDLDLSPTGPWLEDSVETLERYPMDLIDWPVVNSNRIDIVPLGAYTREPGKTKNTGYRTNGYVLPIDERAANSWSENVWRLDGGGKGLVLDEPSPYLLAYYLGLYHGFIKR